MRLKTHLKKGDNVEVISGDDKGRKGRILKVLKVKRGKYTYLKILVESVNFVKKHTRKSQKVPQGGIVQRESPINISNVMLVCPRCGKPTRAGIKFLRDGTKARMCKECKEIIEG